jgi:hypothetical protein
MHRLMFRFSVGLLLLGFLVGCGATISLHDAAPERDIAGEVIDSIANDPRSGAKGSCFTIYPS